MSYKQIHTEFLTAIKKDLEACDVKGNINTPRWGGRHIYVDRDLEADLYVRFKKNDDYTIAYVIASIHLPDHLCGHGLLPKLIEAIKLHAPNEISELHFECVTNARLVVNLVKRGFKQLDSNCNLSLHLGNTLL